MEKEWSGKFIFDKETKNTIRYAHPDFGPIYIKKSYLGLKHPEEISISLTFNTE